MPGFSDGPMGIPPLPAQYMARTVTINITPASVGAATVAEQIFACPGANVGDEVSVSAPSVTAGVGIISARVSSANNIGIAFVNPTAGGLTPAAGNHLVQLTKTT